MAADSNSYEALLIEAATLIDGTGTPAQSNTSILVQGEKITAIVPGRISQIPPNTHVINAAGKFVMPGMIDMHTHTSTWTPPLYLINGVTSVMDTGNYPEWVFAQAEGIAKGRIFGARLFPVGKPISPEIEWVRDPRYATETIEQARAVTSTLIQMGAAGIKVHRLTGTEMLRAVVEVAHEAGVTVSGHLGLLDARDAAQNGIDGLQHASGIALATIKDQGKVRRIRENYSNIGYSPVEFYMDPTGYDELIEFLLQRQVTLIPTLYHFIGKKVCPGRDHYHKQDKTYVMKLDPHFFPYEAMELTYSDQPYVFQVLPPNDRDNYLDKMRVGWEKLAEFVARFKAAGGNVLAGTDDGNVGIPGLGLPRELEILVGVCGFSPMEAILATTQHAARFLRHEEIGTVKPGNLADILVLDDNPLAKITNVRSLHAVIQNGRVIDHAVKSRYDNPIPLPAYAGMGPIPVADAIPRIEWMDPSSALEDSADLQITVNGKNFFSSSVLRFDTSELPLDSIAEHEIRAKIPKTLLRQPGSYAVTVTNPGTGGGPSNIADFIVRFKYPAQVSTGLLRSRG